MPNLVRLYVQSVLTGFGLSAAFVALLLLLDVAGLRRLVLGTDMGWLGGVMLFVFNGIVFAGVQFGVAVMRMAEREDQGPRGGRRMPVEAALLIPVPARDARRG